MSTSYYFPIDGISSMRLVEGPGHDRLTIFEHGANAGELVLSLGMGRVVASALAQKDFDDSSCPMRTHYGGKGVGCVVTEHQRGLDPNACLISENGKIFTVAQIRELSGAGKQGDCE